MVGLALDTLSGQDKTDVLTKFIHCTSITHDNTRRACVHSACAAGAVNVEGFKAVITGHHRTHKSNDRALEALFSEIDTDQSGGVTWEEFSTALLADRSFAAPGTDTGLRDCTVCII